MNIKIFKGYVLGNHLENEVNQWLAETNHTIHKMTTDVFMDNGQAIQVITLLY